MILLGFHGQNRLYTKELLTATAICAANLEIEHKLTYSTCTHTTTLALQYEYLVIMQVLYLFLDLFHSSISPIGNEHESRILKNFPCLSAACSTKWKASPQQPRSKVAALSKRSNRSPVSLNAMDKRRYCQSSSAADPGTVNNGLWAWYWEWKREKRKAGPGTLLYTLHIQT